MKIVLEPQVFVDLSYLGTSIRDEFSGFAYCRIENGDFVIYEVLPMNIGSYAFTEIKAEQILKLMERPDHENLRVWLHKHPMGSDRPGPQNWSARDNLTIETQPLGGVPELVGWSVSIVLTSAGVWVGRVDNHRTKETRHLEVVSQLNVSQKVLDFASKHPQPRPYFSASRELERYVYQETLWDEDEALWDDDDLDNWEEEPDDPPIERYGGFETQDAYLSEIGKSQNRKRNMGRRSSAGGCGDRSYPPHGIVPAPPVDHPDRGGRDRLAHRHRPGQDGLPAAVCLRPG